LHGARSLLVREAAKDPHARGMAVFERWWRPGRRERTRDQRVTPTTKAESQLADSPSSIAASFAPRLLDLLRQPRAQVERRRQWRVDSASAFKVRGYQVGAPL
jgi:hypothetical protein